MDGKVDQILEGAFRVMSEKGFERASMEEIATAAGVAKGTLYYHFKNKDDLFNSMVQMGISQLTRLAKRELENSKSAWERLRLLIGLQVRYLQDNAEFCKILLTEVWGTDERQQKFRDTLGEYLKILEEILEAGKKDGSFHYKDTETAASAIFGGVSIASLHWVLKGEPFPEDTIVDTVTEIVLKGLK